MKIKGTSGDDYLFGSEGRDTIKGGRGNDTIDGQLGRDKLFGGQGQDTFILSYGDAVDRIVDFNPRQDTIAVYHGAILDDFFPNVTLGSDKGPVTFNTAPGVQDDFDFSYRNGVLRYDYDGAAPFPALPIAKLASGLHGVEDAIDLFA